MRIFNYIKETKGEMKHVSWPTKKQATAYTLLVIVLSIALAAYLGLFDWLFTHGLEGLIGGEGSDFNPADHINNNQADIDAMIEDATGVQGSIEVTTSTTETN